MPPKQIEGSKNKSGMTIVHQDFSKSSLYYVPEDANPGYEERFYSGISWNDVELSYRNLENKWNRGVPLKSFTNGFQVKIDKSCAGGLVRQNLSALEVYEYNLAEKFDLGLNKVEEEIWCYRFLNYFVDDMDVILRKAIGKKGNTRDVLIHSLYRATCIRLMDAQLTNVDVGIRKFKFLTMLNLGCNFITETQIQFIPPTVKLLELNGNRIKTLLPLVKILPKTLFYLGLSRNLLDDETDYIALEKERFTILDLSDNNITDLEMIMDEMRRLRCLLGLSLYGNPCSMAAGYAVFVKHMLPKLKWLDHREIREDTPVPPGTPVSATSVASEQTESPFSSPVLPEQLRANCFMFFCHEVTGIPQHPRLEKNITISYHVELELPLLDGHRRQCLMKISDDSQTDTDYMTASIKTSSLSYVSTKSSKGESFVIFADSDIGLYNKFTNAIDPESLQYKIIKTNKVSWQPVMTFQEPSLRILVPNMTLLRDTFRTEVTLRIVCTVSMSGEKKGGAKNDKELVVAVIKCQMQMPDWGNRTIYYKWDNAMENSRAQFVAEPTPIPSKERHSSQILAKAKKSLSKQSQKQKSSEIVGEQFEEPPEEIPPITCAFSFSIDTVPF